MSLNGHGPKLGKVVGNGLRIIARDCQRSPEVPVDLKCGLQPTPGPGRAANGHIRRNRGPPRLINTGVGGMAQPLNDSQRTRFTASPFQQKLPPNSVCQMRKYAHAMAWVQECPIRLFTVRIRLFTVHCSDTVHCSLVGPRSDRGQTVVRPRSDRGPVSYTHLTLPTTPYV